MSSDNARPEICQPDGSLQRSVLVYVMNTGDPALGSMFQCLADERRRHVLGYFQNNDGETASCDDLADHVIEQQKRSSSADRETVTIDLSHRHLPKLADHGVVEFDRRTRRVQYRGDGEIETVLGRLFRHSLNGGNEGR